MVGRKRNPAPGTHLSAPRFTIDLSLPPYERYKELAAQYRPQLQHLIPLFDNLLSDCGIPERCHGSINWVAKYLLRGVHSPVETAELRGIADSIKVPMYLLVALNVVLDLLMGCTSGGVKCCEARQPLNQAQMLHFRLLDWGMDPLREIVVQLDFVRSASSQPSRVIASSVTYVGFVGVLTGVCPGLSMSLNFRGVHNEQTRVESIRYQLHRFLVLLGRRPSISSLLRGYLFTDPAPREIKQETKDLASICTDLESQRTTAAYLIFCDGHRTVAIDKDFTTLHKRESTSFLVTTNHDVDDYITPTDSPTAVANQPAAVAGMAEILEESRDRMNCLVEKWDAKVKRVQQRAIKRGDEAVTEDNVTVTEAELIRWVTAWPTANESTHFGVVMDPVGGEVQCHCSAAELFLKMLHGPGTAALQPQNARHELRHTLPCVIFLDRPRHSTYTPPFTAPIMSGQDYYGGGGGGGYNQGGYPPNNQSGYPPQHQGGQYPDQQGYNQQGYPPQHQQGGYPPQQGYGGGYPPQQDQHGYNQHGGGYPPQGQQQHGGYGGQQHPQHGGAPPYQQQQHGGPPGQQYGQQGQVGPEGERGLGASLLGGAAGGFAGHKMGGGGLGTIGGMVAGAIGANVLEHATGIGGKKKKKDKKHKKEGDMAYGYAYGGGHGHGDKHHRRKKSGSSSSSSSDSD
ncbi:hypothetical protein FH972_021584 [Carpinus fangiana]|uniref:ceramidase n=1 Tax=Carpinus fangiana TaxID=176857 RepID=A0A5N6KQ38_9ROSI|nr:hypothetical protein FH972_021584 [Carpinus fangiana]